MGDGNVKSMLSLGRYKSWIPTSDRKIQGSLVMLSVTQLSGIQIFDEL